jgi:hypothetical protein
MSIYWNKELNNSLGAISVLTAQTGRSMLLFKLRTVKANHKKQVKLDPSGFPSIRFLMAQCGLTTASGFH